MSSAIEKMKRDISVDRSLKARVKSSGFKEFRQFSKKNIALPQ